jgi:O-antigen ligase
LLGWFHGGYAPTAWGWTALVAFWITTLTLLFRAQVLVDAPGLALLGAVTALTAWTALSGLWSLSVPRTMFEVERDLVYVGCIAAVVVVTRTSNSRAVLIGLIAGLAMLVAYSLGAYLVSSPRADATQGYLLFRPVGYANALGGVTALALTPALALATHDVRRPVRAAAGAATVILSAALFLTQNRSGWIAVGVALAVWVLRTHHPESAFAGLLLLGCPAGTAVAIVASLNLFDKVSPAADIRSHRLVAGGVVVTLALVASALAAFVPPPRLSRALAVRGARAASLFVVLGLVAAVSRLGDRAHYWHVAWRAFLHDPVTGSGAGTFELQWFRYRDLDRTVRDAHNLYLGTLGELGLCGLLLVAAVLVLPIITARRSRDPLLTAALASYCGFLVHLAFEWDWKFPLVTGSALVMAAVLGIASPASRPIRISGGVRLAGVVVALFASAFVVATLAGNSYLVAAESRIAAGDTGGAVARADRAREFLPWASEPWLVISDSRLRNRDLGGARAASREALARDPSDWTLWVRLAAVARGDQRAEAVRRALALNPLLASRGRGTAPDGTR